MAVLGRVAEPHPGAVREEHTPRSLDLHEEEFDRVVEIEQFEPLPLERARIDFRARVIRLKRVAVPPPDAEARIVERAQLIRRHLNEIVRAPIDGDLQFARSFPRTGDFGLVIAGDETRLFRRDAVRDEMCFEEAPRSRGIGVLPKLQHLLARVVALGPLAA